MSKSYLQKFEDDEFKPVQASEIKLSVLIDNESFDDDFQKEGNSYSFTETFQRLAHASLSPICTNIFFQLVGQMNIIFVGQADDPLLLAGVGMGSMLINIFCFATSQGLNGTIESFVARDFGAGNKATEEGEDTKAEKFYKECGNHLNRARVIICFVLLPIFVAFFWADTILISLQQDQTISTMARNYVVWALPGIFALIQFDCRKRWLQSLNYSFVSTQPQVLTTCTHALVCWLLILRMQLGVFGAAMALNITYIANFLLQEIYVRVILREELKPYTARLLSPQTLEGWITFLKLGVPGTLMQCFEWWAFEVLAIFAGLLGTLQLAAHVAVINVCAVVFMIPLGIQFTASGLVGTSIGAGNPSQAKRYALTAVLFSFVCMGMISILLTTQSEHVARIFTKDPETIAIIVETLPMISLYIIVSGIQGAQSGNVRALGQQMAASITTLVCYYLFGMPLAIYLGFTKGLELYGFWLGFTIALVLLDTVVGLIVFNSDWSSKSLGEDKVDTAISRSVKITRQNSMYTQSPLQRQDTNQNESPQKKRLNMSANSSTSSVRVRRGRAKVDDDHFTRQD